MVIYTILIFLLLVFTICEHQRIFSKKINIIIYWFLVLIIFLIAALRSSSVGADTWMYCGTYDLYLVDGWDFSNIRFEIGYSIFVKLLTFISTDSQILIFVTSFFITLSVATFCFRFSKYPIFALLLYVILSYYMSYMNIMREALAVSILLWGFGLAKKRGVWPIVFYELLVALAITFHTAAIIATIIPFLKYIKHTKFTIIIECFIGLVLFVFAEQIFGFLTDMLGKYSGYAESQFGESNYFGALVGLLFGILYFGTYIYASRKELYSLTSSFQKIGSKESAETTFYISISIVYIFTLILTMKMNIFNRLGNMFAIYNIILITEAFSKMKSRKEGLYKIGFVSLAIIYFYIIIIFRPEWNGCVPYSAFFE